MYDTFKLIGKSKISAILAQDVYNFDKFLQCALDLICYTATNAEK